MSDEHTKELEILPCYCRSKTDALSVKAHMDHGEFGCRERARYVYCSNCWACGPARGNDADAIRVWNQFRSRASAPQGDAIHWQLKAGVAETMCGVAIEAEEGIRVTLLSDMATCKACDAAAWGYKWGRADAASSPVSPSPTPEQKTCAWCKEKITTMYFGSDGRRYCSINCQLQYEAETRRGGVNWESAAPPSTQPSARVAAEEIADLSYQRHREEKIAQYEAIITKHCFPSVQPVEEQNYAYAVRLATVLRDRFYADNQDWQPLDTLNGVLSQIDNMIAGLPKKAQTPVRAFRIEEPRGPF